MIHFTTWHYIIYTYNAQQVQNNKFCFWYPCVLVIWKGPEAPLEYQCPPCYLCVCACATCPNLSQPSPTRRASDRPPSVLWPNIELLATSSSSPSRGIRTRMLCRKLILQSVLALQSLKSAVMNLVWLCQGIIIACVRAGCFLRKPFSCEEKKKNSQQHDRPLLCTLENGSRVLVICFIVKQSGSLPWNKDWFHPPSKHLKYLTR